MGEDATKEKEKKCGSKLGIDNKKDGLIPSFYLSYLTVIVQSPVITI